MAESEKYGWLLDPDTEGPVTDVMVWCDSLNGLSWSVLKFIAHKVSLICELESRGAELHVMWVDRGVLGRYPCLIVFQPTEEEDIELKNEILECAEQCLADSSILELVQYGVKAIEEEQKDR